MIELTRIIWDWDPIVAQLASHDAAAGYVLGASCRPVAADRWPDGTLELVVGCWYPSFLQRISAPREHDALERRLGALLSESKLKLEIVAWPGGMAPETDEEYVSAKKELEGLGRDVAQSASRFQLPFANPPNPLSALGEVAGNVSDEARKCETILHRLFFAKALTRGIHLACQYPVLNYRIDFAVPDRRMGADILGWTNPRRRRQHGESERVQMLEMEGWYVLSFSGQEVSEDVEACLDVFERELRRRPVSRPGESPRFRARR